MKIRKIFDGITYIIAYRVIAIAGIIFIIGIIIHTACLESDTRVKAFVIFLAVLGLFVILSLLFVANSFDNKENETPSSQKEGTTE